MALKADIDNFFAKAITLDEHVAHAVSHLGRAARHLQTAKEHHGDLANYASLLSKADATAANGDVLHHALTAGEYLGRASEQQKMAVRHLNALTGNQEYGDNPKFKDGDGHAHMTGVHLDNAIDHLHQLVRHSVAPSGETGEDEQARKSLASRHLGKVGGHVDAALEKIQNARDALGDAVGSAGAPASLKGGEPEPAQKAELIFKRDDSGKPGDEFEIFMPILKAAEQPDGTLIVEAWANVSDLVDGQGEYFSPEGLRKFAESWAPFGNFRGQHDANWPAGTIRSPIVGKAMEGEPLGWWIRKHPATNTDGLFVRCHVVDLKAIQFIKSGVFTGLSVGGKAPTGSRKTVQVEVDDNDVVLREVA